MKRNVLILFFALMTVAVVFSACAKTAGSGGDDEGTPNNPADSFKISMLTNYADTIIIPAYDTLKSKLDLLDIAAAAFIESPSTTTQDELKAIFRDAYISYENVSFSYFGPAGVSFLNHNLNSFPTDTADIEASILSGEYNFAVYQQADTIQGFPALDYLFFSSDAIADFIDAGAQNRKDYAQAIITRMKLLVNNTLNQWKNSYRTSFINNTRLDVGSSIGFLINQFAYEMDQLKGPRIGWPGGKQSGGILFPDKCEGYYGGFSLDLAIANLTSLQNFYKGGVGRGLDDYLVFINRSALNTTVSAQFDVAIAALNDIPAPLSDAFSNNQSLVNTAYGQVQILLTLLKTDVASATGVRITYADNDGD